MKAEDIRRLYREVHPGTAAEAAEVANEAQTDPDQARRLIQVVYSLSVEDRTFALLLRLFLEWRGWRRRSGEGRTRRRARD